MSKISPLLTLEQYVSVVLSESDKLRSLIDNAEPDAYPQFNINLPDICFEETALLAHLIDDEKYAMCFSEDIGYFGANKSLSKLSGGEYVHFESWEDCLTFISSLIDDSNSEDEDSDNENIDEDDGTGSDDTKSQPYRPIPRIHSDETNNAPKKPNADLDSITDWSEISIPSKFDDTPSYETPLEEIRKTVVGQEDAINSITYQTAMFLKKRTSRRPLSFLLHGVPGTGKSETAKAIGKILENYGYSTKWTELNTFQDSHSVYRLIGSPPGYVGYDDDAIFETVVDNPKSVLIFDELDKAHPEVLKTFMSILDEGRINSNKADNDGNRIIDFSKTIIFFTSNYKLSGLATKQIGFTAPEVEKISCENNSVKVSYKKKKAPEIVALVQKIYEESEKARKAFTKEPGALREIASRFGTFVEFKPLTQQDNLRILAKLVVDTAAEYSIPLLYISPSIMQGIINATSATEGLTVRSFRPVIEGYLSPTFAATDPEIAGENQAFRLEGTIEKPLVKITRIPR